MNELSHFEQLLAAAKAQSEPQRLLFVFAAAELPDNATPAERAQFEAGEGGALAPLMCVDKSPAELPDFHSLLEESRRAGPPWQVVFAAALSGQGGQAPSKPQIDGALQVMIEAVRDGGIGRFAAYDASGEPVDFH